MYESNLDRGSEQLDSCGEYLQMYPLLVPSGNGPCNEVTSLPHEHGLKYSNECPERCADQKSNSGCLVETRAGFMPIQEPQNHGNQRATNTVRERRKKYLCQFRIYHYSSPKSQSKCHWATRAEARFRSALAQSLTSIFASPAT